VLALSSFKVVFLIEIVFSCRLTIIIRKRQLPQLIFENLAFLAGTITRVKTIFGIKTKTYPLMIKWIQAFLNKRKMDGGAIRLVSQTTNWNEKHVVQHTTRGVATCAHVRTCVPEKMSKAEKKGNEKKRQKYKTDGK